MASLGFWELAVGVSADLSEGLTNLAWELGALGVVEEEQPGLGARLRAFFPGTFLAGTLEAKVAPTSTVSARWASSPRPT
jgi:hypothetical protein